MATANWPTDLPTRFIDAGFAYGPKPNVVSTTPQQGPTRTRRRSTGQVFVIQGSMELRRNHIVRNSLGQAIRQVDQMALMQRFHADTLKSGSLRFNWVDPVFPETSVEMLILSFPPARSNARYGVWAFVQTLAIEMYK